MRDAVEGVRAVGNAVGVWDEHRALPAHVGVHRRRVAMVVEQHLPQVTARRAEEECLCLTTQGRNDLDLLARLRVPQDFQPHDLVARAEAVVLDNKSRHGGGRGRDRENGEHRDERATRRDDPLLETAPLLANCSCGR